MENSFASLSLTKNTLDALNMKNYVKMTEIQRQSLPFALEGKDVLGAAKTGSGKTLAFIIPVLELLYKNNWTPFDGLGALIISPTRELAIQIFQVLRDVGKKHTFSAGLLIGGKDLKQEQERVGRMNILVATPGRLLQHMDQTPEFDCNNLQILVLDEADRILDSGFASCLNAIIENLPKKRQTLLFSATQTKAVKDLARLSVKDAEYVAVHEGLKNSTPDSLTQHYMVCDLPSKLDILFSFIKTHLKQKILVFLASGKQVRFVYEAFCKMQPGIPLSCLHGKQNQQKRMGVFAQFSRKSQGCLFATDVAARGLDIPAVDWVVQVDCPDDTATYIHRVGRTARYESAGHALLLLLPSEKDGMLKELESKKVPIEEIKVNPSKILSLKNQLSSLCSQSPDMKYLAQKSFITYMRSIYLQSNKDIFDVHCLPAEEYAESLGLPGAPNIKFKSNGNSKNKSRQMEALDNKPVKPALSKKKQIKLAQNVSSSDEEDEKETTKKQKTKIDKLFAQKNHTVLSQHYSMLKEKEDESDEELLTIARKDHDVEVDTKLLVNPKKKMSKTKRAKQMLGLGTKVVFNDDGTAYNPFAMENLEDFEKDDIAEKQQDFMKQSAASMEQADVTDKHVAKERRREIKRAKKLKEKELRRQEAGLPVTLAPVSGSDYEDDDDETERHGSGKFSAEESEDDTQERPSKKAKMDLQSLENLALELLN